MSYLVQMNDDQLTRLRLELLDRFVYCPLTGELTYRKSYHHREAGMRAGSLHTNGCELVGVEGKVYYKHRLIWLMEKGEWPPVVDHVDGVRSNYKLDNLRAATTSQNNQNIPVRRDNTSGVTGVSFHKRKKVWVAVVCVNRKQVYLGCGEFEDAVALRKAAETKYYGEFVRRHQDDRSQTDARA